MLASVLLSGFEDSLQANVLLAVDSSGSMEYKSSSTEFPACSACDTPAPQVTPALFSFNKGLPLTIRSVFYPLLGERIWGWPGHVIDILAVLATMFGLATSLGLGGFSVANNALPVSEAINYTNTDATPMAVDLTAAATTLGVSADSLSLHNVQDASGAPTATFVVKSGADFYAASVDDATGAVVLNVADLEFTDVDNGVTTATALAWALYEVGKDPDQRRRARGQRLVPRRLARVRRDRRHPVVVVEPLEPQQACLQAVVALHERVARLARRLFGRQLAQVGDRQPAAENVVALELEFRLRFVAEAVANRRQRVDELVERGVIADFDEVFDASRHVPLPDPRVGYRRRESRRNH